MLFKKVVTLMIKTTGLLRKSHDWSADTSQLNKSHIISNTIHVYRRQKVCKTHCTIYKL